MSTCKEFRQRAWDTLRGNWTNAVVLTIVVLIVTGVGSVFSMGGEHTPILSTIGLAYSIFVGIPLTYGVYVAYLRFVRSGDSDSMLRNVFDAFSNYWKSFLVCFLMQLFTALWMLLLIVPGIIKALSYAMAPYIQHDHPELTANEAIDASMDLMKGHKWQLFLLYLSFIGWILLGVITFGIGLLWVVPYMNTALVHFYEELIANQQDVVEGAPTVN